MPVNSYLQDCRQLLQAFEDTQSKLIRIRITEAVDEFRKEIIEMSRDFDQMHHELENRFGAGNRLASLNMRQLERLQIVLKELRTHVERLAGMDQPDHRLVLFIFQRQYKFKQIFRRHLTDYARLQW